MGTRPWSRYRWWYRSRHWCWTRPWSRYCWWNRSRNWCWTRPWSRYCWRYGAGIGAGLDLGAGIGGGIGAGIDAGLDLGAGIAGGIGAGIGAGLDLGAGIAGGIGLNIDAGIDLTGDIGAGIDLGGAVSVGAASTYADDKKGVEINAMFEGGLSSNAIGHVVASLRPVLGAEIGIVGHVNMKKITKSAHRLRYRGISDDTPVKYGMSKFRVRKFNVASATIGSIGYNEFRVTFNNMDFIAKGGFDMVVDPNGIGLDLGGRLQSSAYLPSVQVNVQLNADDSFTIGRCVVDVKKLHIQVLGACSYEQNFKDYLI